MNSKERLFKAMKCQPVDRAPCICPGGMMNMVVEEVMEKVNVFWPEAHCDPEQMAKLTEGMHLYGGFENFGVPFCMTVEAEALGAKIYMGTQNTEPRVKEYAIEQSCDLEQLLSIESSKGRVNTVLEAIRVLKNKKSDVPIVGNLTGPISLAASLLDPNVFYKDMRKNPEAIHRLLSFVTEQLIAFGKAQIHAGADVIAISDPSGTGEILGAKQFAQFALPYINKIVQSLKPLIEGGVIVHICGRLKSIFSELGALKADVISFDSVTSVLQVVENVKDKAIMGNVSTFSIENGDTAMIEKLARNCMGQGVDILAPACGVGPKSKLENVRALSNAWKNGEVYVGDAGKEG